MPILVKLAGKATRNISIGKVTWSNCKKMKISPTCKLHIAGACISEISRKSCSASTGGKIPPQEGRQLKIYELCRTPRKLWYLQSLFFAFTKEDQNFHRPVLESKSYVSKVSSNSQSLSDLFLWSEFSVPFKTFQKGISLIKKFPRSYNSTKKILNKRWKLVAPFKSKNMSSETDWRATCGELEACVYSPD